MSYWAFELYEIFYKTNWDHVFGDVTGSAHIKSFHFWLFCVIGDWFEDWKTVLSQLVTLTCYLMWVSSRLFKLWNKLVALLPLYFTDNFCSAPSFQYPNCCLTMVPHCVSCTAVIYGVCANKCNYVWFLCTYQSMILCCCPNFPSKISKAHLFIYIGKMPHYL